MQTKKKTVLNCSQQCGFMFISLFFDNFAKKNFKKQKQMKDIILTVNRLPNI